MIQAIYKGFGTREKFPISASLELHGRGTGFGMETRCGGAAIIRRRRALSFCGYVKHHPRQGACDLVSHHPRCKRAGLGVGSLVFYEVN